MGLFSHWRQLRFAASIPTLDIFLNWRKQSAKLKHLRSKLYTLELENSLFENFSKSYGREFLKENKKGNISQADLDTIRQLVNHSGIDLAIDRCLAYPHKVPYRNTKLTFGQKLQIASLVNREIRRKLKTESVALKTEFDILECHIESSQLELKSLTNKIKELSNMTDCGLAEMNNREYAVKFLRFLKEEIQKLYQEWNKMCLEGRKIDSLKILYCSGNDAIGINDLKLKEVELKAVKEESLNLEKEYATVLKKKRAIRNKLYTSRHLLEKRTKEYNEVRKCLNLMQPKLKAAYQIQYDVENDVLLKFHQLSEKRKIEKLGGFDDDDFLKKKLQLRNLEKKIEGLKRRLRIKAKLTY